MCRSSVLTVKETYHNLQICFSGLPYGELSFLDFQKLDGWVIALVNILSHLKLTKALDHDLGFCSVIHGVTHPLFVCT